MDQRHGVDFDDVVDDELHPGQANALGGQLPPAKGGGGAGDVHHDLGFGIGHVAQVYFGRFVVEDALVKFCPGLPRHRRW